MSLANTGQKLKAAREAQGLSLVQIYERTKIPLHHLEALEVGDTEELPEPVYISGFIKRYADCIGLDGQVLSDDYKQNMDSGGGRKHADSATPFYATADYVSKSKPRLSTPTYKLWIFNSIIIVGVVATITWFINVQQSNIANQTDPSLASLRSATQHLAPVAPPPSQPAQNGQPAQPIAPVLDQRITLSATKHVWVEVKRLSNSESVFTGYLEQGDRRDFEDTQGLIVRAGDGGSLSVERQGKIEPFGLSGKVVERQFVSIQSASNQLAQPAASTAGTVQTASSPVSRPVLRRVRRSDNAEAPRPRRVEPRRYDNVNREAPARYSEGRLDSD